MALTERLKATTSRNGYELESERLNAMNRFNMTQFQVSSNWFKLNSIELLSLIFHFLDSKNPSSNVLTDNIRQFFQSSMYFFSLTFFHIFISFKTKIKSIKINWTNQKLSVWLFYFPENVCLKPPIKSCMCAVLCEVQIEFIKSAYRKPLPIQSTSRFSLCPFVAINFDITLLRILVFANKLELS